jgi:hypothetical protein
MTANLGTVWVSVSSHRARGKLRRTVGDPGRSFGLYENWYLTSAELGG